MTGYAAGRIGVALVGLILLLSACHAASAQESSFDGVLRGHLGSVFMGVFTPDGQRAITVSSDETARCWDLATGQETRRFKGHTGPVYSLAISGDGRTLATGAQDNSVLLWDIPQTRPLWSSAAHSGPAGALSRSADSARWLTAGEDNVVRLWEAQSLQTITDSAKPDPSSLSSARSGHEQTVLATALRNDGALFASADTSGRILLWSPFVPAVQGELQSHPGGVTGLAFHANNQQLISAGRDGLVRIWQLPPVVPRQAASITAPVCDVAVASNQAFAVVATQDQVTRVVDLNTGGVVREFPRTEAPISALAVSANNALVAVATETGTIRVVNFADGADRGEIAGPHAAIRDVVFHPNAQSLFTAGADGAVRVWQVPPPEGATEPTSTWAGIEGGASALAVSADGATLFVGDGSGGISVYRTVDGELQRTLTGHTGAITELALVPNTQQLISASRDQTLRQWELENGTSVRTIEHPATITGVSSTTNGQRIASIAEDGRIRVWDTSSGMPLQEFSGHAAAIARVRWLNDNQTLVSGSADQSLRIWKTTIVRAFAAHDDPIHDMALFGGGGQVITCASEGPILMSDLGSGQPTRTFAGLEGKPVCIAIRTDNQRLAAGSSTGKVSVWNSNDAQLLQTLGVQGAVTGLAWSNDNQKLAVATAEGRLYFFGPPLPPQSPQPGNELVEHDQVATGSVLTRIAMQADQRSILATHADGTLASWAYASPIPLRRFNHGGPVQSVAISRDGKTLVSASADQTIRIWNATTGQEKAQLRGHEGQVLAVALSPDESAIVSSGADRTVRLWDATGGKQMKQLATLEEAIYTVDVHPSGQRIAAGGADRRIYLFNVLTGEVERVLEGHTDYIHSVRFDAAGTKLLSYSYAGDLRCWDTSSGQMVFQQQIGRIGNFASYSPDATRALLSNGDDAARLIPLPAQAR